MTEQIKFYFDEHVSQAVVKGLQRRGVDILTVRAAGRSGLPDDEQLDFALQQGRVTVTMDSDYAILSAQGAQHAGIAYTHLESRSIGELIRSLMLI